jgi:TonB-linked SusC/RagA family outer membrane protein
MHIFSTVIKRIGLPALLLGVAALHASAQQPDSLRVSVQDSISRQSPNSIKVTGTVKDAATGEPLQAINISVPGYSASITDKNGSFTISVPNPDAVVVISAEGFQSKEVALRGKTSVSAVLYEDTYTSVNDEVSLPYTKKLGNHVTGAVKSLNVSDNWQRIGESVDTYLQGRVTGLNVIRRSGTPGIGASLFLRGFNSVITTSQPLYVVDGVFYDNNSYGTSLISGHLENPLANIDFRDIDNITVIKDATASTYGTKAANGVVLINTARAKQQATRIDFGAYGGYNFKPSNLPVLDAAGYRTYLSDLMTTDPAYAGLTPLQIQAQILAQPYMNDDPTAANPDYARYHYNTNWQDQVLDNSYNQTYYMKVTGGDNIATYGLSVGYTKNRGVIRNSDMDRYQTRFNADLNLSSKMKGQANLSFVSNEQNLKDQGLNKISNPLYLGLTKSPFLPVYQVSDSGVESPNLSLADGFGLSNPVALIENARGSNKNYRFLGSVGFTYLFNKNLNLNILGGIIFSKVRENIFIPEKGVVPDTLSLAYARNRSGANVERLYSVYNDTRLSFTKTFNYNHDLGLNVGFRYQDNKSESDYGLGFNAATDDYVSVGNGQAILRRIGGENGDWRTLNTYLNADYAFKHKYFLSFNIAADASSRFGKTTTKGIKISGNPYAILPSVGAAWLLSSERFMADNNFFSLLKLRGSYGLVGNDDLGNYTAKQYYLSQNFLGVQGLVRGNVPNTSLHWETVEKANLGLDAGIFNDRLNLTVDLFKNITHDMVVQVPVATITGFDYALSNDGKMSTTGFEAGITGRILNKGLKWDAGFNISTYRNKVESVPGGSYTTNFAGGTMITKEGQAANLFYGNRSNGVYATEAEAAASGLQRRNEDGSIVAIHAGDVRFIDENHDGFIDNDDRQVIGNPNPDFNGMFSNTLSFKRFSMDALFTFSSGNDVYNYMRRTLESMNGFQNQTPVVVNRWKAEGQVTNTPRAVLGDPAGNSRFSDRWIEDGSYIRLRTLSLTYDIPFKARAIKYAKVYVSGNNLFTLSKYLGYDPEFSPNGSIYSQGTDAAYEPQFRSVQLGVRIGL